MWGDLGRSLLLFGICFLLLFVSSIVAPISGILCLLNYIELLDDEQSRRLRGVLLKTAVCSGLPIAILLFYDANVNHVVIPFLTRLNGARLFIVEMALAFLLAVLLGDLLGKVWPFKVSLSDRQYFQFLAIFWLSTLFLCMPLYFAAISLMIEPSPTGAFPE